MRHVLDLWLVSHPPPGQCHLRFWCQSTNASCKILVWFTCWHTDTLTNTQTMETDCREWLTWLDTIKWLDRTDFFVSVVLLSTFIVLFLLSSSVSLSCFNLAVTMRKCLGKHSCMSSPFSIAILNGTCSLRAPILLCGDEPAIKQLNYKQTKTQTNTPDAGSHATNL